MGVSDRTFLANLGDVNPLDHGGLLVFREEDGSAMIEQIEPIGEDHITRWEVRWGSLDRCYLTDGILSDNEFHKDHPAWFADMAIPYVGWLVDICSDDPVRLATAYRAVYGHYGWDNFDDDPIIFTDRDELSSRYSGLPISV